MSIILTGYQAGPDNAYAGHPDGGTDTSTGVPLDERYATFAIPGGKSNAGRTNLKLGDVVLFQNKTPDGKTYTSLGWATDLGGLPHGDIDVAHGDLEKNLGLQFEHNKGNTYVTGVLNRGEVSGNCVGHISAKGFKNPNVVNEAIKTVNAKLASGEIKPEDAEAALTEEMSSRHYAENLEKADKEVETHPRSGGYGTYDDAHKNRRPVGDDLMSSISDMFKTDPMMALLMVIVGLFMQTLTPQNVASSVLSPPVKEAAANITPEEITAGKQLIKDKPGSAVSGSASELLDSLIKSGKVQFNKSAEVKELDPHTQLSVNNFLKDYFAANPTSKLTLDAKVRHDVVENADLVEFNLSVANMPKASRQQLFSTLVNANMKVTIQEGAHGEENYSFVAIPPKLPEKAADKQLALAK